MILLSDEFAFLAYVSHEGGSVAASGDVSRDSSVVSVLLTLGLLRIQDHRFALTANGEHALATGEARDGISVRYFNIPESFPSRSETGEPIRLASEMELVRDRFLI